jgi:hypothetical protein
MAGVKHAFNSVKSDGADATLVRPSNWNADHVVTDLAVAGQVAWQADESITIAANTDNQAVGAGTAVVEMTATGAARNLTGLTGGADGRLLLFLNVGTFDIVLVHDATSTAANRFFIPNATNFTLPPNSGAHLVYDISSSRWRVVSAFNLSSTTPGAIGTAAVGAGLTAARGDHVHASGAGTPSTQAFGDAAATGAGPAASMTDHKHAMPADPVTAHVAAGDPHTGYATDTDLTNHAAAADPHTVYVLESLFTAKGTIITASAASTPSSLAAGADDTILMADAAAAGGLKWVASATPSTQAFGDAATIGTADTFTRGDHKHAMPADPVTNHVAAADPHTGYVLESAINAKGDLYAGTADNTPGILTAGANDTILMADSAAATGLKWVASQVPVVQAYSDAATEGTADTYARGDHRHGMPASGSFNGDVGGQFSLQGDITDTSVGTQNDWAPTGIGTASTIRWNGASALTLSGIASVADGRVLFLMNVTTAQTITLRHDLTSTAANRFFLPNSVDNFKIAPNTGVQLQYDATSSRWRVVEGNIQSSTNPAAVGTVTPGTSAALARDDHVHATGAGTPSTQAFGDAAAIGGGPAAAMTDHKHAMPADPTTAHAAAADPHTGYRLESADHTHASTGLQAGTVAHSALTGLTNDEHTQYVLEATAGITGTLALTADISPAQIVANVNDYNPSGLATATVLRLTSDAARTITGLQGGADGRVILLVNANTAFRVLTLSHDDALSTAANRFYCPGFVSFEIAQGAGALLEYDSTDSRWRVVSELAFSPSAPQAIGTAAPGTSPFVARRDHVHGSGAGTPSTQAFGDAPAIGTGPAAAMTDHKHGMPSASGLQLIARKTADEGPISSTTFQADDHLIAPVGANETWMFEYCTRWTGNTTGIKFRFTFPASAVMAAHDFIERNETGTVVSFQMQSATSPMDSGAVIFVPTSAAFGFVVSPFRVMFVNGPNAGNFGFEWAPNTAATLTCKINSTLWGVKIA